MCRKAQKKTKDSKKFVFLKILISEHFETTKLLEEYERYIRNDTNISKSTVSHNDAQDKKINFHS